jgi:hypothetical protein
MVVTSEHTNKMQNIVLFPSTAKIIPMLAKAIATKEMVACRFQMGA